MTQTSLSDPVAQAAADWFVQLQGQAGLEDWTAFQAWLDRDPEHALAYDAVENLWVELDTLPSDGLAPTVGLAGPYTQDAAPIAAHDNVVRLTPRPPRRWVWAGASGLAAAAVVLAVLPQLTRPIFTDYQTAPGETRSLTLADGSHITLSGDTALKVRLSRARRDIALTRGQAAFDIAHDPARPLVVAVADREVRVLGTQFNIASDKDRLSVTVRRGVVQISGGGDQSVRLTRGQALIHEGAAPTRVTRVDPEAAFSWMTGKLVYQNAPLSQVAADLNRYGRTPIQVDPKASGIRVSGVLQIDREETMLRRLALFAPIVSETGSNQIVLKAKPARP